MSKLPVVSGRDVIKAIAKIGYRVHHQKGSHIHLKKEMPPHSRIVVPDHKELRKGTLRGILRDAGLSVEEFVELL